MRSGGFGFNRQFGFSAPAPATAAAAGPSELFPDPTLADVADSTDGWQYTNGFPTFGPEGGTGPGLQADSCLDDDLAELVGADDSALTALLSASTAYDVAITFANVTAPSDITVDMRSGTPVTFIPANGVVTHEVTTGASGVSFRLTCIAAGGTFDITAISVTAA